MRRRTIAVVMLAAALATAVSVTYATTRGPHENGPASFGAGEDPQASVIRTTKGSLVVFGANVLHNDGTAPLELTSAELVGDVPHDAAELVEARAIDPARTSGDLVGAGRWPYLNYRRLSQPLPGYVVEPGGDAELLLVVRIHRDGAWQWPNTQATYSVDGREFVAATRSGFMACAPRQLECVPELG